MSAPRDDRDLAAAFDALREEDRETAPAFRRMWDAAGRRAERRAPRRWVPAASLAGAAAVVALAAYFLRAGARPDSMDEAVVLAEQLDRWEAPSDAFVVTYDADLGDSVPSLDFESLDLP